MDRGGIKNFEAVSCLGIKITNYKIQNTNKLQSQNYKIQTGEAPFGQILNAFGEVYFLPVPAFSAFFDWGFKLDRQPGESPSRIFISIGQAF